MATPQFYPLTKWGSKLAGVLARAPREREDGRAGDGQGLVVFRLGAVAVCRWWFIGFSLLGSYATSANNQVETI